MYKVEDILKEMFMSGMISKEEYAESICEHRNDKRINDDEFENQFEFFSNECEKYADDAMANFITLNISGSSIEKEMLQKIVKLYGQKIILDIESGSISSEEAEMKKIAHEIMVRSLHFFKIE